MKSIFKIEVLLLALFLSCVSFVMGRSSTSMGQYRAHATQQMNELDRLQMETAGQK